MKRDAFPKATYRGHRLTCRQLERLICVHWGWGVAEGTLERVGAPLPEGRRGQFPASTSHLYVSVGNRAEAISDFLRDQETTQRSPKWRRNSSTDFQARLFVALSLKRHQWAIYFLQPFKLWIYFFMGDHQDRFCSAFVTPTVDLELFHSSAAVQILVRFYARTLIVFRSLCASCCQLSDTYSNCFVHFCTFRIAQ